MEMNTEAAADAGRNLHRVIVGDVQSLEIEEKYDAIIATELYEHLNYPDAFLTKIRRWLRPGGRIVLSTPNVGHYSDVRDLFAGRWDYLQIGILCYTHFRFFTAKTLIDWVENSGYSNYRIIPQKTELPLRYRLMSMLSDTDAESLSTKGFYVVIENT